MVSPSLLISENAAPVVPSVRLPHGASIPQLGLGTWRLNGTVVERNVMQAVEMGYRLFDTAESYENEEGVGRGLAASSVPREEVFVTTKFTRRWHGSDLVATAVERSAARLGLDYLDLVLIHWPNPDLDRYVEAWRGLIALLDTGVVRAIGTSNFKPAHLERIISETGVVPDVNQIQFSPAVARPSSLGYHLVHGIVTESWSPMGGRGPEVLKSPVVKAVARRHGRTAAQVVLRWHIQLGMVVIPRSSSYRRMRENISIFDFSLSAEDVAELSSISKGEAAAIDSDLKKH